METEREGKKIHQFWFFKFFLVLFLQKNILLVLSWKRIVVLMCGSNIKCH